MSFRIACQAHEMGPCFEVFGEVANHLDSIARYVRAKATDRQAVLLDIRAVTTRPSADKVFIHVLKYPSVCLRKIALVDLTENRRFCSLYEQLVRTRGYQVRFFGDVEKANEWLSGDDTSSKASRNRFGVLSQALTALRQSLNPMRIVHATTTSR
jgi:hypothetical protein